ncbi:hypothetical protein [Bacillus sp. ISL-39]|uniref:hypothetical protein n=1 Tax=Bacillus sp. ISL-39 TaxID=2819124 RepID=UPI001BEAA9F0|nr:hypothetical protein [Bacillus sp. ISL-39]MBT2638895.1 hypothetical protein [Bacillus sp. ISL-39]
MGEVSLNGDLSRSKAKYFEAQRSGDNKAMNQAKEEAMKIMNEYKRIPDKDKVEVSDQALTKYKNSIK